MKTNIFIPKEINVGYQNRDDTYTKKLAYVIYFDEKGKLRKEASWNSWRDKKIDNAIFDNVPTAGLVLNKKVGGYSSGWNHRNTYVRVYDPRNFEFEISVPNLLYILENTNSIKGKGLDGEFVYGWDGADLILIPTTSPDYIEISEFNSILHEKRYIKSKELTLGAIYKTKDNSEWIYMGRFDCHDYNSVSKKYFFYNTASTYSHFQTLKSLGDKIIGIVSENCVDNYAEIFGKLEHSTYYSPVDDSKDEYIQYDYDDFINKVGSGSRWGVSFYIGTNNDATATIRISDDTLKTYKVIVQERVQDTNYWGRSNNHYYNKDVVVYEGTLEDIYINYKPMYKNKYLINGKLHKRGSE